MKKTKKNAFVCTVHASDRDDVPNHGIRKEEAKRGSSESFR